MFVSAQQAVYPVSEGGTVADELTEEELPAISKPDIGLLYVLGVNGPLLMHYAALWEFEWDDYIQAMKDGIEEHGEVRAGMYVRTGGGYL